MSRIAAALACALTRPRLRGRTITGWIACPIPTVATRADPECALSRSSQRDHESEAFTSGITVGPKYP